MALAVTVGQFGRFQLAARGSQRGASVPDCAITGWCLTDKGDSECDPLGTAGRYASALGVVEYSNS